MPHCKRAYTQQEISGRWAWCQGGRTSVHGQGLFTGVMQKICMEESPQRGIQASMTAARRG